MKRTYLKFPNREHLPTITSRRQQIGGGKFNIAYRSDAKDDDDDDDVLETRLQSLKNALEKTLTRKQREDIDNMIEVLEGKLAKKMAKDSAPLIEKLEASEKTIQELKTAAETSQAAATAATTKAAELEKIVTEQKERADKNQEVIDAFVVNKDKETKSANPKSFDQIVKDTIIENTDAVEKFIRKESRILTLDLKLAGDMYTSNVTGSRYGSQFSPTIVQLPYRRVHVRSLVPTSSAGPGNTYTHMREATTGEGAIAPVAETSSKPQLDLDLIESSVNFETIAGYIRVSRKAMSNIPGFTSWIQRRLPEKLLQIEDDQLLYGSGSTPNIKGLNHTDNHTAADDTALILAERLIDAVSQMEDELERYPDGILVRPKEYYNFFKNKAEDSGVYDLPKNFTFVNGVLYVSGIPVFSSTAVTDGDYFVGDWSEGAELLIQENIRLEFFEQDADNVTQNKITVRIEETVAFPVYGKTFFILGATPDES